jgi:nucleoside-diphosphate-sugar epimerase
MDPPRAFCLFKETLVCRRGRTAKSYAIRWRNPEETFWRAAIKMIEGIRGPPTLSFPRDPAQKPVWATDVARRNHRTAESLRHYGTAWWIGKTRGFHKIFPRRHDSVLEIYAKVGRHAGVAPDGRI